MPFAGIDKSTAFHLLIGEQGGFSAVIRMTNPVIRYGAHPAGYEEFHQLLINVVKVLGDGFILQKHDVISHSPMSFHDPLNEYLQQQYQKHFEGRDRLKVETYLTITRQVKKGAFYVYDGRLLHDFCQTVDKVLDILPGAMVLTEEHINHLVMRLLSMNFGPGPVSLNNILPGASEIRIGELSVRSISLSR